MSKVAIVGDSSGTGTFTISAPNGNTDRTLVLPDEAGTVLTSAGVPASAMPAGSVIQVVNYSVQAGQTSISTTGTWYDTPLSKSITPTSATSKILVLVEQHHWAVGTNATVLVRLLRDATEISSKGSGQYGATMEVSVVGNFAYLDSPATTSAITYKTQCLLASGGTRMDIQTSRGGLLQRASITLMEIAA